MAVNFNDFCNELKETLDEHLRSTPEHGFRAAFFCFGVNNVYNRQAKLDWHIGLNQLTDLNNAEQQKRFITIAHEMYIALDSDESNHLLPALRPIYEKHLRVSYAQYGTALRDHEKKCEKHNEILRAQSHIFAYGVSLNVDTADTFDATALRADGMAASEAKKASKPEMPKDPITVALSNLNKFGQTTNPDDDKVSIEENEASSSFTK